MFALCHSFLHDLISQVHFIELVNSLLGDWVVDRGFDFGQAALSHFLELEHVAEAFLPCGVDRILHLVM